MVPKIERNEMFALGKTLCLMAEVPSSLKKWMISAVETIFEKMEKGHDAQIEKK